MSEVLHYSRAGIQGPLLAAGPAMHSVLVPAGPAFPAWVPASPNPHLGFVLDPGIRHKQAVAFEGAAAAAEAAEADNPLAHARRRPGDKPLDAASPYHKAAAQRAAEGAIRPWDPAAGLGERQGAPLLKLEGANAGPGAFARPDAPSLYAAPTEAAANAHAAAAGRVGKAGQGQGNAPGAYSVHQAAPARELWPVGSEGPPKYCTACRGPHDHSKAADPLWQPYHPGIRLTNLNLLETKFQRALFKGLLACSLSDAYWEPVRWRTQPQVMAQDQFTQQLSLALDGIREGHEPHRYLATQAVRGLLGRPGPSTAAWVAAAAPSLVGPLKLCLNTMQPALVGGCLLVLIRLFRLHPVAAAALSPYFRHLLPPIAVFRTHTELMELPPPVCVPPAGPFSGRGPTPDTGGRACRVCGAPLDAAHDADKARADAMEEFYRNPAALKGRDLEAALPPGNVRRLPRRAVGRYTLAGLIEELLGLMAAAGGSVGRRVIRSYVPTFTYYTPQDAPPCVTVEEQWEAAEAYRSGGGGGGAGGPRQQRRPQSAPRAGGGGRAAAGAAAGARPSTASPAGNGARRAARKVTWTPDGGGTGGTAGGTGAVRRSQPAWNASAPLDEQALAHWDGIEFTAEPYGKSAAHVRQSYDAGAARGEGGGGGAGGEGPKLRVLTPVPVFDSPHDPLYRMLAEDWDGAAETLRKAATFAHAGPEATRKGGAPRGGAGGAGGTGLAGGRGNVNAAVAYKASPSGVRRGF